LPRLRVKHLRQAEVALRAARVQRLEEERAAALAAEGDARRGQRPAVEGARERHGGSAEPLLRGGLQLPAA
jgi:hypothetical protein